MIINNYVVMNGGIWLPENEIIELCKNSINEFHSTCRRNKKWANVGQIDVLIEMLRLIKESNN